MTNPLGVPFALLLQAGGSAVSPLLFEFVLIVAIIYFIMWRPQQQARRKREDALRAIKRGDEVVTSGGIVGEIVHIRESSKDGGANRMDDRITIKSGESRLIVERGRIDKIIGTTAVTPATNNPPT
ncbi:MAG TPA: preprotein translocase subunit YajC [Gemmatimonadaceae bacterium]|jgi:preprotein translocase subunit YajC|nr:preprotein translocase subunit YajC [Gemmatimonadaceae bacterium]